MFFNGYNIFFIFFQVLFFTIKNSLKSQTFVGFFKHKILG